MAKLALVFRHELFIQLAKRSFILMTFGIPLLASLVVLGATALNQRATATAASGPSSASTAPGSRVEGYVDLAGLIKVMPSSVPAGSLRAYDSESAARAALKAGDISAYYVIPSNYMQSGDLTYVNPSYRFAGDHGQAWVMQNAINANLLGNDSALEARFMDPMQVTEEALAPAQATNDLGNSAAFYIPYATVMIFYFVIIMAASLLLNSVSEEKKNRVLEILLVSVTPRQMLTGKITALGVLGLLQMVAWVGTGYGLLKLAGQNLQLPPGMVVPPSILAWGMIFFLLGYAIYASLMAGLGALSPNLRESSQAVILVLWPLILPLFTLGIVIGEPNGTLAVAFSIFPLTAPTMMMLRLAATNTVPLWHILLAIVLMAGTAVLIIRAVAGMFRAQYMLSGQALTPKRFLAALVGRA